jgi:hypothetical protein
MDAGEDIPDGPICSEMPDLMGTPVFPLVLAGRSTRALFDTGAHLSYIHRDLVEGQQPSGHREDFSPFVGRFSVPTYIVPTALDPEEFAIEYGIHSGRLWDMLQDAMCKSDSLAIVGTQLLEFFDCTLSWTRKQISWERLRPCT